MTDTLWRLITRAFLESAHGVAASEAARARRRIVEAPDLKEALPWIARAAILQAADDVLIAPKLRHGRRRK